MRARGFVFSLDAFVAFVLIMITINLLIFTIGTPKPYFSELESAHILAHDTLQVLATSGEAQSGGAPAQTYLERILRDDGSTPEIMRKVAGGNDSYRPIIPKGYGYRLEYLNLNNSGVSEDWVPLYDAGKDMESDRYGRNYTKLQASATTFLSAYLFKPMPGESPFCHAGCRGYELNASGEAVYARPCDTTPCNITTSDFRIGKNTVRIVRLAVYT
ncbi:MAG: hypothetical protein NTX79_06355 [Candidatus Micrarchaeota archaeon]|nr:hypothetical protein [Candidatus Micrarchaeota archaeon]